MSDIVEVVIDRHPTVTAGDLRKALEGLTDDTPITGYLAAMWLGGQEWKTERYVNMTGISLHPLGEDVDGNDTHILTFEVEDTWEPVQF